MIKDPGRLAWTVLIASLLTFCVATSATALGVRWFLFDSTTPLNITLNVGRGTVSVQSSSGDSAEQAERATRQLNGGLRLTTDSTSQGFVTFQDPYTHEVVASLVLHRDSSIVLESTTRPRFNFSTEPYTVSVVEANGKLDVDVLSDLPRSIRFDVKSPLGWAFISDTGRYIVSSQSGVLSVLNQRGQVVMIDQKIDTRSIPEGMEGQIAAYHDEITVSRPLIDILPDGTFDTFNPANVELSSAWRCYSFSDDPNEAEGEYKREIVNGRSVMHFTRKELVGKSASNHAETGCLQYLNTANDPLILPDSNYLELRATIQIRFQQGMLNTCGQVGSECPIMLVFNYQDKYGQDRQWLHGFYTKYDQAVGWPLRCATCSLDHERLNEGVWYTFSSGNLMQLLPEDQRPVSILNVHFYASGHEYEVMLSEVEMLTGNMPQPVVPGQPVEVGTTNEG